MGKTPAPLSAIILLLGAMVGYAALHPAKIFSDHMVLQQNSNVPIWGIADAKKVVTVRFADQTVRTKTDGKGQWKAWFKPMKANSTGRELKVTS